MTTNKIVRPVPLECGHKRWFKYGVQLPRTGEQIWCTNCADYMTVGVPLNDETLGYFPDYDWSCRRKAKLYYGKCEVVGCEYEARRGDWFTLKPLMESHHLRAHSGSSLLTTRTFPVDVPLSPRGTPPPF